MPCETNDTNIIYLTCVALFTCTVHVLLCYLWMRSCPSRDTQIVTTVVNRTCARENAGVTKMQYQYGTFAIRV